MKKISIPPRTLFIIVLAVLFAFDAWATWLYVTSRQDAGAAREQLVVSRNTQRRIERLRDAPIRVDEGARSSDALAQLVESAAQQVGLDSDRIVHIDPGVPRPLADTPYEEQSTEVELREVTIHELVKFSLEIPQTDPGVHTPTLLMRVSPGDDGSAQAGNARELWNAQMTLTSHIYAPKIAPQR